MLLLKLIDVVFEYEIALQKLDPIVVEGDLSIIAVVGDKMKTSIKKALAAVGAFAIGVHTFEGSRMAISDLLSL